MCDAKIRPLPDNTELKCEREEETHGKVPHRATLRDYAYPGSETIIHWWEDDRRNFRGEFLHCEAIECMLPRGHRGHHTQ